MTGALATEFLLFGCGFSVFWCCVSSLLPDFLFIQQIAKILVELWLMGGLLQHMPTFKPVHLNNFSFVYSPNQIVSSQESNIPLGA